MSELGQVPASMWDRLLDATERSVVDAGSAHLTLDAVAQAAGVSKGGLLYYFPSKTAWLEGMIERHVRALNTRASRASERSVRGMGPVHGYCGIARRIG